MPISKLLHVVYLLVALTGFLPANRLSAQVLPLLNSFKGRTFTGTVDVSWPVLYDSCTFLTDSVVLNHSYGALFRNCRFESKSGTLYIADSGDGIILAGCDVTGADRVMFNRDFTEADRNYVTGITIKGEYCSVLDDQESIIDIDGLELAESVSGASDGPLIMIVSSDRKVLKGGETANLTLRGLEKGMFVGWLSSHPEVKLSVSDDGMSCSVSAPQSVGTLCNVVISAYTEYGLEAACVIKLLPDKIRKR